MITSKGTARKQIPAIHKWAIRKGLLEGRTLDYGGGPYNLATEYLAGFGVTNLVIDPYNRSAWHNTEVFNDLSAFPANTAIIANVLNVVPKDLHRIGVLVTVLPLVKRGGLILIACHAGNKTGIGQETLEGCWQENRPTRSYLQEVQTVFPSAYYKYGYIIAIR